MISGFFIGILFGAILQASQFCFVSGFRNIFYQKNTRFLAALFIAVSIQAVGLFVLKGKGMLAIPQGSLPLLATILGGLLFGCGIVLSGCCGSGAWFRSGEGLIGTWIALFSFSLTMASAKKGSLQHWLEPLLHNPMQLNTIYDTFGISPWILIAILLIITISLVIYNYRHPRYCPPPLGKYKNVSLNVAGCLIGILGIVAWVFSADAGRNFGFGVAVPSGNIIQYLVTGQHRYINWGSLFVIGILVGAIISTVIRGEMALRLPPDGKTVVKRLVGGVMMGIGATLAGGCTVTNALVATAYFSWQAWIATITMMIGVWIASYFFNAGSCKL